MEYLSIIHGKYLKTKKNLKWKQILLLFLAVSSSVLLILKFVLEISSIKFPGYIYISNVVISTSLLIFFRIKKNAIVDETFSEVLIEIPSEIRIQIEVYFENNASFLNSSFSFDNFVADLKLPKQKVSKTINHEMKSNFYNLLAEKRIEVAKELLYENKGKLKIAAVSNKCGFVSKSSFSFHFRKHVGMTPSQFQKINIK